MTVTQRRNRPDPAQPEQRMGIEPGIKVTCDFCHIDITHSTVRFKCADEICQDIDICPTCFCEGKEGQRHKAWHDYRVEEYLSTPIFSPDWGADEELLLISGLITFGLGNWLEVAGYIGTRTKEECEKHYYEVFLGVPLEDGTGGSIHKETAELDAKDESQEKAVTTSQEGKRKREFMPPMDAEFVVDSDEWQVRKKARIEEMRKPQSLPASTGPLVSAPTNHEIAGFMPGRLEFEHEVENEAEMAVKDLEFGLVWRYGGDQQKEGRSARVPEDDTNEDDDDEESGKEKEGEAQSNGEELKAEDGDIKPDISRLGSSGEAGSSSDVKQTKLASPKVDKSKDKGKAKAEEPVFELEDEDELDVKLALLDIYFSKLDKREEAKEIIFDRGLTEHKRIQAADRKRARDERDLIQRFKVFAKLQTAEDFEVQIEGLIVEQNLRKRIAELQEYRRMGITTAAEAEVYDQAKIARAGYKPVGLGPRDRIDPIISGARVNAGQNRFLQGIHGTPPPSDKPGRETPKSAGRRPAAPLNLANSQSLDLLTLEEQSLCSSLRILPKPYLTIKETYLRENERRKGGLRRRDARRLLRIDVNKSGQLFDFLVTAGYMRLSYDPSAKATMPLKDGQQPPGAGTMKGGHALAGEGGHTRPGLAEVHLPNGGLGVR